MTLAETLAVIIAVVAGLVVFLVVASLILLSCSVLLDLLRRLLGKPGTIAWGEAWQGVRDWLMAWGTYLPVRLWCIGQTHICVIVAADIATAAFLQPELEWDEQPAIMEWVGLLLVALLFWLFVLPFARRFWSRRSVNGWLAWAWCSVLPVAGTCLIVGPASAWFPLSWPAFLPFYTVWIVTCCLFWPVVFRQYPARGLLVRRAEI